MLFFCPTVILPFFSALYREKIHLVNMKIDHWSGILLAAYSEAERWISPRLVDRGVQRPTAFAVTEPT